MRSVKETNKKIMAIISRIRCVALCSTVGTMLILTGCSAKEEIPENLSYAAEEIPATYKAETDLLKKYPEMEKGKDFEITYDFDCEEYQELLEKYDLERIAGEGTELERVMRLVDEFAVRLTHESYYDNSVEEKALPLLEYSLDKRNQGINCRAKAIILKEMCLALDIYARSVSIIPYSSVDPDSHVVNEIYDTQLEKWVMVDMTTGGYVVDANDVPLSILEIRQCGIDDVECAFVCENYKIGPEEYTTGLGDNLTYYMKNVFFFAISKYQGVGLRSGYDENVFFIPTNFELKNQMLSNSKFELEFANANPEYAAWAEDIQAGMEVLRKTKLNIGNVEKVYSKPEK